MIRRPGRRTWTDRSVDRRSQPRGRQIGSDRVYSRRCLGGAVRQVTVAVARPAAQLDWDLVQLPRPGLDRDSPSPLA
jgi:hypothetical protein